MNIQTIKSEIVAWVTQTNDDSLLQALKSLKDSHTTSTDWPENLTPGEKESLNRGILNHEQGEVLTSEEFWSSDEGKI